jgi:OPA family sugar phosphate sensor protein UhpC-like MFS transporter
MKATGVIKLFKSAVFKEEIQDPYLVDKKYRYWRIRIFYSMYVGYVFFYFTRKSFTFIIPQLISELGYSYTQLGLLSTILYITYGISKFVSGILSDQANPRYFMAIGLIFTGVFNILFGFSSSLWLFAIFVGLNGWFQGWGWPPITKQLTHWYSKEERGLWWSFCSTSHNVGGAIIPIIVGYYAERLGWRYAMHMPGIMCIVVGILLINRLRDVPRSLGLPPIEKYKQFILSKINNKQNIQQPQEPISNKSSTNNPINNSEHPAEQVLTAKEILFGYIFNNYSVIIMAICCFFIYIVKTAINDWAVPFLVANKGYSLIAAGTSIVWFELGGLLGMLFTGWVTDRIFSGKRIQCIMIFGLCLAVNLWLFWQYSFHNQLVDFIMLGSMGFFVFGPQMLIGLAAAEHVDPKVACSANGFVSWWGCIGAAVAGLPLGMLIDAGWNWFFFLLLLCSVLSCIVLIPIVLTAGKRRPSYLLSTQSS